jgi:3-oxoacyl-[acyl-carrier-protein] synthase II
MIGRRVVITGLGWATSLGMSVPEVWQKLLAGQSGVRRIGRWDPSEHTSQVAGEITDWDGSPHMDFQACKRMDRFAQFAMGAGIDAVTDSGLDVEKEDPWRIGVIIGSGIGGMEEFEAGHRKVLERGVKRSSPLMIPKLMINAGSANLSIHYGFKGVNYSTVTACAAAGHAIADSLRAIALGDADVIVTGGSEAAVTPLGVGCFMTMRALSTAHNDEPHRASRPFDRDRDGFVIAEGCGALVLEEYERAKSRGATIYAEVLGAGMTGDGGHITAPDEKGTGAAEAMRRALASAEINADQIDHINPHATSTHLGDAAEHNAIKTVFGDHAANIAISATKSMTGHLLGASGGIEAVMTALAVQTGDCPPTINHENPDEGFDLNYCANEAQHHDVKYAMCNNFGFGGHNIALILGKV